MQKCGTEPDLNLEQPKYRNADDWALVNIKAGMR